MNSQLENGSSAWKRHLQTGLEEDGWQWDWTTLGTQKSGKQKVQAKIVSKGEGIWAANGLVEAACALAVELGHAGSAGIVRSCVKEGEQLKKGTTVCEWSGTARLVLALERPFLNLASYVSGIATNTNRLVELVRAACPQRTPRVTATRKTLPGYRDLAIHGVLAGGGHSHRINLAAGVLIKENHIMAAGGIPQAIHQVRKIAPHGLKIEVEVTSLKELEQALEAQADFVLLDNFTPQLVRSALKVISVSTLKPGVEVSGGVNERTISDYAVPGVDLISVGGLTHSVSALDLSLLVIG